MIVEDSGFQKRSIGLFDLTLAFLKIGSLSFGGYMSLVSMIENDLVQNRSWLTQDKVIEAIALASFLPGPLAVNISTYVGYSLRGWSGALVSMCAVLLPSCVLVIALTHFYLMSVDVTWVSGFFLGVIPAVVAIILKVGMGMWRKNIVKTYQYFLIVLTISLCFLVGGLGSILLSMIISGIVTYILEVRTLKDVPKPGKCYSLKINSWSVIIPLAFLLLGYTILEFRLFSSISWEIARVFSVMSVTLFGGGYVFIPMMQEIIVDQKGWLGSQEFVDAIAIGQITPGPILISAAFVGYKLKGLTGAIVATISVFLPSSILMTVVGILYKDVSSNPYVGIVFNGVKTAIVGLILFSAVLITYDSTSALYVAFLALSSFMALELFKTNAILLILLNGMLGIFVFY